MWGDVRWGLLGFGLLLFASSDVTRFYTAVLDGFGSGALDCGIYRQLCDCNVPYKLHLYSLKAALQPSLSNRVRITGFPFPESISFLASSSRARINITDDHRSYKPVLTHARGRTRVASKLPSILKNIVNYEGYVKLCADWPPYPTFYGWEVIVVRITLSLWGCTVKPPFTPYNTSSVQSLHTAHIVRLALVIEGS